MNQFTLTVDSSAIGILIAGLALWAQLWLSYSSGKPVDHQRVISLRLFWIYGAIFFALVAFISSVLNFSGNAENFKLKIQAISFIASLIMSLINIGESTFSLALKMKSGQTHDDIHGISENQYRQSFWPIMLLIALILLGDIIIILWGQYAGTILWLVVLVLGLRLFRRLRS